MFGFKAYFNAESVYIDGRAYRSNEVLTDCLNLSIKELTDFLKELIRYRELVQLQAGGNRDYCKSYNEYAHQSQNLFSRIMSIAAKLPIYKKSLRGAQGRAELFDCLNQFIYWKNSKDFDDTTREFFEGDYYNEYGYSLGSDGVEPPRFYFERFVPGMDILESDDPEIALDIERLNESVRELFDEHITFVCDLIRVQTAYTDLLDHYIHGKSCYLNERELAEAYRSYLSSLSRKRDYERVDVSGTMKLSYEPYRSPGEPDKLCEVYTFDSLGAFLYVDFFHGLRLNHIPKRCDNCGRYFLIAGGKYNNYCERTLKDDPDKTCRDVGARRKYGEKCKDDPVWLAYNRAYKTHYARYMKKKMTAAQFEQWSRQAVEWRNAASEGKLPQAEYERIIKE
ncbi:MAG: hypothetical protein E7211_19725 [Clostridium lundense]|nr:hypothetical protein [Clostridium lundense]